MTPRRLEILQLLSEGLVSKEIGEKLGLNVRTIDGHLEKLFLESGCNTRCQLMIWAVRKGHIIVDVESSTLPYKIVSDKKKIVITIKRDHP